jgi:hypothetical protein
MQFVILIVFLICFLLCPSALMIEDYFTATITGILAVACGVNLLRKKVE